MIWKVVLFGTSDFGRPSFEQLRLSPDIHIVAVVTQPPRPTGRNQELTPSPIETWATEHALPILTPATLRDGWEEKTLTNLHPDIFLTAAYGLILPASLLQIPRRGAINIHASLLPAYRGASPIAAAIADGQPETGVSFMLMDEGIDTGPVLASFSLPILATDSTPELTHRLSALAAQQVQSMVMGWLAGSVVAKPQPTFGSSYVKKLTRQDGRADWQDAHRLARLTRAYQPWPGVWSEFASSAVKFISAESRAGHPEHAPGTVVSDTGPSGWAICCANGWFIPTQVQMAGKKTQPASVMPGSYPTWIGAILS